METLRISSKVRAFLGDLLKLQKNVEFGPPGGITPRPGLGPPPPGGVHPPQAEMAQRRRRGGVYLLVLPLKGDSHTFEGVCFNSRHPGPWRAWKGGSEPRLLTPDPRDPLDPRDPRMNSKWLKLAFLEYLVTRVTLRRNVILLFHGPLI